MLILSKANCNVSFSFLVRYQSYSSFLPLILFLFTFIVVVTAIGRRSQKDPVLAKYACIALCKLATVQGTKKLIFANSTHRCFFSSHSLGSEGRAERFQSDHVVFQELCAFLKSDAVISDDWFPGAER